VPLLLEKGGTGRQQCAWLSSRARATRRFLSGADISQFEDCSAQKEAVTPHEHWRGRTAGYLTSLRNQTVACIRGYCIGGGGNVAISCDIRVASFRLGVSIPATRLDSAIAVSAMNNSTQLVGSGLRERHFLHRPQARCRRGAWLHRTRHAVAEPRNARAARQYTIAITTGAPLTIQGRQDAIIRSVEASIPTSIADMCRSYPRLLRERDYAEGAGRSWKTQTGVQGNVMRMMSASCSPRLCSSRTSALAAWPEKPIKVLIRLRTRRLDRSRRALLSGSVPRGSASRGDREQAWPAPAISRPS